MISPKCPESYVPRMLVVDLFVPGEEKKLRDAVFNKIRNDLKLYQNACRQICAALYTVEAAGAVVKYNEIKNSVTIKSSKEGAQKIFENIFEAGGKAYGYPMRDWIKSKLPGWRSDYADFLRLAVISTWRSKDPEFNNASRGWLALNFSRNIGRFNRFGIPARPVNVDIDGHDVTLEYRLGDPLKLKFCTMDPSRWHTLKKVATGEWPSGTVYFKLNDKGLPILLISYYRPPERPADLNPERVLEVATTSESERFFVFSIREGRKNLVDDMRNYAIGVDAAVHFLDELGARKDAVKSCKEDCGNFRERKKGEGHRKGYQDYNTSLGRLTKTRTNATRTWNHTWAKRVITIAQRWRCGEVVFFSPGTKAGLLARSWPWSDFTAKLQYRCDERGIKLAVTSGASLEQEQEQEKETA